jgi:hypothetical protein
MLIAILLPCVPALVTSRLSVWPSSSYSESWIQVNEKHSSLELDLSLFGGAQLAVELQLEVQLKMISWFKIKLFA